MFVYGFGLMRAPLYVWRLTFRLRGDLTAGSLPELHERLNTYRAVARVEGGELLVWMRVAGHVGPASAIGKAAQMLGHHAANAGFRQTEIQVVRAERISAPTTATTAEHEEQR
jgi:hypothetical protein